MKQMPMIEKYMTTMPHSINTRMPLETAMRMMREHNFRHLPVEQAGKLVGVITDRDIKLARSFQGQEELVVEDVMSPDPYTTTPHAPLDQVVLEMAERKYGCVIVQQENHKVVGIFTATDGLRVLGEVLKNNFKAPQI